MTHRVCSKAHRFSQQFWVIQHLVEFWVAVQDLYAESCEHCGQHQNLTPQAFKPRMQASVANLLLHDISNSHKQVYAAEGIKMVTSDMPGVDCIMLRSISGSLSMLCMMGDCII